MKSMRIAGIAAVVSMLVVGLSFGGYIDTDTFQTYPLGSNFAESVLGQWDANTNTVVVGSGGYAGQGMYVPSTASASNDVNETSAAKVWTDFRIKPALGVENTNGLAGSSASTIIYFNEDGYVGVCTGVVFTVCSNSVWGDPVNAITEGTYAEIAIFQDFTTEKAVVFVNGVAVMQDIDFVSSTADYKYLVVDNVDSNAYLDNVRIQTSYDSYHTLNSNGAWGIDVDEVHTYGYLGRTLHVGTGYYTFNQAMDIYRGHDELYVHGDSYSQSFTVSTNVVFVGEAFTNSGTVTIMAGGSISLNDNTTLGSLNATGDVTVAAGKILDITSTLTLAGSATMTVNSGADINVVNFDMDSGTTLVVTDAEFASTAEQVDLEGTFTIYGNRWPGPSIVSLPFSDTFEIYSTVGDASIISNYGFFGWYTTDADVKVVDQPGYAGYPAGSLQCLSLPDGTTLSNRVSATAVQTNVWTTYYICANRGAAPSDPQTNAASFLGYVDTNGYMVIAVTGATEWVVCDDGVGVAAPAVTQMVSNDYTRVDIHVSIDDSNSGKFALFVDGVLVRQQETFPGSVTAYKSFLAESADGDAYLDDILISTELPSGLTLDTDGNLLEDGYEIHQYGFIGNDALGSRFKFR